MLLRRLLGRFAHDFDHVLRPLVGLHGEGEVALLRRKPVVEQESLHGLVLRNLVLQLLLLPDALLDVCLEVQNVLRGL